MKNRIFNKRVLSFLLTLLMIVGVFPAGSFVVSAEGEAATVVDPKYTVSGTNTFESNDPEATLPTDIENGSHWEGPVKSADVTCGEIEHTHTDDCYSVSTIASCDHASDQLLDGTHPRANCLVNPIKVSAGFLGSNWAKCASGRCGYAYHYWDGVQPYHSNSLSSSCGHVNGHNSSCYATYQSCQKSEHTHTEPACYTYTWTLKWNTHKVIWTWKDAENKDATKVEENVNYGTALDAPEVPETIVVGATTYTFKGWDSQDADNEPDTDLKVTGDMTYTAVYSSETLYAVTFNTDGGSNVNAQKIVKDQTATKPENPTKAGFVFVEWVDTNGNEFDFATKITADVALKAVWAPDTNNNGINDETETIKVIINENGEVKLTDGKNNVINATNVTAVYDSTSGKVTVVATPASGYYVDVTVNNGAVLKGSWKNTDIDSGWGSDKRNVYTGSFAVEAGKSYEVTVTNTKFEWSLPKDAVTVSLNGYLFNGITSVPKAEILKAIYGEDVNADLYHGAVDEGWGSVTIKLETPFQYKVTLKATDKYPTVSDTIMVTASDNRTNATIENTYVNGSFNTEEDFKSHFANNCIKVNNEVVDLDVLLNWNGNIEWTKNDDGTYTAVVTLNESKDWLKSSATFSGLTWTVSEYAIEFKDWDGSVIKAAKDYPYGTLASDIEVPADPTRTGYTFTGWNSVVSDVTGTVTYVATYEINKHTVTWTDENGVEQQVEYEYGATVTVPAAPVKEGHTFLGWKVVKVSRDTETIYQPGDTFVLGDAPVKLEAVWQVNQYKITWEYKVVENGAVVIKTVEEYKDYGSAIADYAIDRFYEVEEDGHIVRYYFQGWGKPNGATVPSNDNTKYTAEYAATAVYEVKFDVDSVGNQYIEDGKLATKPADDPTRGGYRFDGWYLNGVAYDFATPVTGDITITAKWVKQVTVDFDVDGGSSVVSQTFDINGKATKPADPIKDQAIFGGWYNNNEEYDFSTLVTEDITLTAKWIADINRNGVADADETFDIIISGNGSYEVTNAISIGEGKYVFDSTNPSVTITVTPVVNDGISSSFVASVTGATLAYGEGFVATADLTVANGKVIEIELVDVPQIKGDKVVVNYNFFTKVIPYGDIYNSVIKAPAYKDGAVKYTYFARPAMKHTVSIDSLDLDSSIKTVLSTIGVKEFSFDMEELWLPLDAQIEDSVDLETAVSTYLTKDRINGLLDIYNAAHDKAYDDYIAANGDSFLDKIAAEAAGVAAGGVAAYADIQAIYDVVYASAKYYGAHNFGYNATGADTVDEQIRIEYSDESMKWSADATVTLKDPRESAFISGSDVTLIYRDYTDEELLAMFGVVDANGNPIEGAVYSIQLSDPYTFEGKNVSETTYVLTVKFAGNANYKAAEKTFNITIVKANVAIDVPNINTTFGETLPGIDFDFANKYGDKQEVLDSLVQIIIGLDLDGLTITEDGKLEGIGTRIQIMLPKDDTLANIFKTIGLDVYGEKGETLSLGELQGYLDKLGGLLGEFDSGNETVDGITNILESITGLVDLSNVEITFGGQYPTDVGVYVYGVVSTSGNYETAYDVGYICINPDATKLYLNWNHTDANGVFTWELLKHINLGATAYNNEAFTDKNADATELIVTLFLGIDVSGKTYLTADPSELADGAYIEIAFIYDFGNEMYYAVPIVRPVVIIPSAVNVELVGSNGTPNNELLKEFNNQPQGFEVIVKDGNGKVIYSTHYQNIVENNNAQVEIRYIGVQSNGVVYNSTEKPVHAGAYAVYAIYLEFNTEGKKVEIDFSNFDFENFDMSQLTALQNLYDLKCVGADIGALVIKPTSSTVVVTDKIVEEKVKFSKSIEVGSTVSGLEPDTTVISAGINLGATAPENIFDAVNGVINIDFPKWVDELLAGKLSDNITVPQLKALLENVSAELSEGMDEIIDQLPENVTLTFDDDVSAENIGAYVVIAIVTDSDHYPSIDAGYLVFVPAISEVELKWNYEDENGVFTRDLLDYIDLAATAYNKGTVVKNDEATAEITYKFLGINANNGFDICDDPATLPNGAYIELAYIEFYINNEMVLSDLIARPVVLVASNCTVEIEELRTEFDNTAKIPSIIIKDLEGNTIDATNGQFTYIYAGLQTNGQPYMSDKAPVHAGVYEVIVTYVEYDENGAMRYYGVGVSGILIDLTESTVDVTGGTVDYDGKGHTANVTTGSTAEGLKPDYTLISGGAWITGDIDSVGINALHGNVNIDFPKWFDAVIADTEAFREGVSAAYLIDFIDSYRDDVVAGVADALAKIGVTMNVDQMNAYIDELLAVLAQMPADVTLTFVDNITYTAPGDYFYYGIVTDSDHYPSTDTGLLQIKKLVMDFDLENTTLPYNGNEQFVNIFNPVNSDFFAIITNDRDNTANILADADMMYVIDLIERVLGREIPSTVNVSDVYANVDVAALVAVIDEILETVEQYELPATAVEMVEWIKNQLATLPTTGTITLNGELPVNVGEYKIYAITYSELYKSVVDGAVLNIAPTEITSVDATDTVYNATEQTTELTVIGVNGEVLTEGVDFVIVSGNKATGAGTYTVTIKGIGNYTGTYTADWTIDKATASVDVNDATKVYGDNDPNFSADINGLLGDDALVITFTREEGENVGEYVITASASDDNYNIIYTTGTLTITKATVTVDVIDASKSYGADDPEFQATVNGLKFNDKLNITFTREEGENVGEYVITATAADSNYNIIFATGKLTITTAKVIVTVNNATKVYGEKDPTFTATVTGMQNGESLNLTFTRQEGENAGEYVITATAGDANYAIAFNAGKLTITKKAITVTADDKTKTYGDADPIFTAKAEGLVGSDALTYTFTRVAGENVGEYAISVTATDANYDITFVDGKLTITKKSVTITANDKQMIAGNTLPTLDAVVSGVLEGDTLNYTLYVDTDGKAVGEYEIKVTLGENSNYNVTVVNGKLTVVKAFAQNIDTGVYYVKLQDAITEVKNDETIVFLANIDEDVTIKQMANVKFTIDGANHKYYGTMTVNGTGYAGAQGQALTIKNVNFMVDGYGIYAYAKNNYARNITVYGCTFVGTQGAEGYDDYGISLRHVYDIVVENTIGTNLYDLVYGGGAVTGFTAENVEILNSANGIWLSYPAGTITFTNVTTATNGGTGVGFKNQGENGVVTFNNCDIDRIDYSEEGTKSLKMIFNDTVNNLVVNEAFGHKYLSIVLNNVDTTVTAMKDLEASTTVSGYKVVYEGGEYKLAGIDYVAQIGTNKYESIQAAVDAAQNGDTIVILASHAVTSDAATLILVDSKNITIDLNGYTLNADIVYNGKDSIRYVFRAQNGATLTVKNGTVIANGDGVLHYMFSNYGDTSTFTIESGDYTLSAVNGGAMFYSENSNMSVKGGTFTQVTNGWMFNTVGNGAGNVITVYGGTYNRYFIGGYDVDPDENPYGEVVLAEGLGLKKIGENLWTVDKHVAGEAKREEHTAPTLDASGCYDMVVYCQNCGAELSRDHIEIPKLNAVAKIGDTLYLKLQDAIDAVKTGETIVFLANIDEDVAIKQVENLAFTIDGADYKYNGTMTVNGTGYAGAQGQALTIKNIHFIVDGYGISANAKGNYARNITVDGCTFTGTNGTNYDYGMILHSVYNIVVKNTIGTNLFDLVYGRGSVDGFTAENVEVLNSANGIWLTYPAGTITFTNVTTATNGGTGVGFKNHASGTVTFNNCDIDVIVYSEEGTKSLKMIFNDTANNLHVNEAFTHKYLTIVLNNVNTTVESIAGLNATTTVAGYRVAYEDGKYFLVEIDYVAQIGDKKYVSLAEAIAKATAGDTIKILESHELDGSKIVTTNTFGYDTLIVVDGKNITIDFNDCTVTVTPNVLKDNGGFAGTLESIIFVEKGASLTLKDSVGNGGFKVNKGTDLYCLIYNSESTLVIESGNYYVEETVIAGSLIYADKENDTTINGGYFTLANASEDSESTKPWIFNVHGKNEGNFVKVNGGYFNQNPHLNMGTQKDCEVAISNGKAFVQGTDGYWYLINAVAQNTTTGVVYNSLAEALAAAKKDDTVTLVADATEATLIVPVGVTLNLNGCYVTAANLLSFGNIIDKKTVENGTVDGTGGIVISNDRAKAFVQLQSNNTYLPIYDANNGCYRFFGYEFIFKGAQEGKNYVKYGIAVRFDNVEAYKLLSNTTDSDLVLSFNLQVVGTSSTYVFEYSDKGISDWATDAYNYYSNPKNTKDMAITMTVYGMDKLPEGTQVTMNPVLTSTTGVIAVVAE